jgi:hypothetical protein
MVRAVTMSWRGSDGGVFADDVALKQMQDVSEKNACKFIHHPYSLWFFASVLACLALGVRVLDNVSVERSAS